MQNFGFKFVNADRHDLQQVVNIKMSVLMETIFY